MKTVPGRLSNPLESCALLSHLDIILEISTHFTERYLSLRKVSKAFKNSNCEIMTEMATLLQLHICKEGSYLVIRK